MLGKLAIAAVVIAVAWWVWRRVKHLNAPRRLQSEPDGEKSATQHRPDCIEELAKPTDDSMWRVPPNVQNDRWLNDLGHDGGSTDEQRSAVVRQWVRRSHPDGADR